jgi:hypothetical protein
VKYIVRLNPKAWNPITQKVDQKRLWEVEQCATRDSEKVMWHDGVVRIDGEPIGKFFKAPKPGEKPWQFECHGICVRSQDNAFDILTSRSDVSGN